MLLGHEQQTLLEIDARFLVTSRVTIAPDRHLRFRVNDREACSDLTPAVVS